MPKLKQPTQIVFLLSLILALLALIGFFVSIPFVSLYAFWFMLAGYATLAAGCMLKGV